MHPQISTIDTLGPALGALAFIAIMSLVHEPTRHKLNAVFMAGAAGAYLSGGLGVWELTYPILATPVAYMALRSYRWVGVGWLMHSCWDIVHHLWGQPIWPFEPTSSFGCMIFDALIALWFFAEAPSIWRRDKVVRRTTPAAVTLSD